MRRILESDVGFYYAVGLFTTAIFFGALTVLALVSPDRVGARELGGLVVGFLLFMLVYFVSVTIYQIEDLEEL